MSDTNIDELLEASARAGHEYLRALRPPTHGPYDSWEELDEEYREYLRGIQRAAVVPLLARIAELEAATTEIEHWQYRRVSPSGRPLRGYHFDSMPEPEEGWSAERRAFGPWIPAQDSE